MTKTTAPARHRSRIAHFKAPFVISVAVPAALGFGCGEQTTPSSLDQASIASKSPVTGEPCDVGATQPIEDGVCPAPQCIDGRWVVYACDPSPHLEAACPGAMPPPPNPSCYAGPRCVDDQWVYQSVACNPPPPACVVDGSCGEEGNDAGAAPATDAGTVPATDAGTVPTDAGVVPTIDAGAPDGGG